MIPDWEHNCVYLAHRLKDRHPSTFTRLHDILLSHGIEVRILANVRDVWARDYCPVQVLPGRIVKFRYDPDYLTDAPELKTGNEVLKSFPDFSCCRCSLTLDGGNIVGTRTRAILTDKVYRENSGWIRSRLRGKLQELLHVDQLLLIPKEPFDPIGHADAMVRFVDEHTVLINDYSQVDAEFGDRLRHALRRHGMAIEQLPYYHEKRTRDGIPSAVGNYANFLRTTNVLVAPVYETKHDDVALKRLESVFTGLPIVPLNCTNLAREGGCFNCVSATYHLP